MPPTVCRTAVRVLASVLVTVLIGPLRAEGALDVIPLPREVETLGDDVLIVPEGGLHIALGAERDQALRHTARQLEAHLVKRGVPSRQDAPFTVFLGEPATHPRLAQRCNGALPDPAWGTEGYRLRVFTDGVVVAGNGPAGTFYGVQTLCQLLATTDDGRLRLPRVDIRDWPAMKWRGTMFGFDREEDVARLASCKMNFVNWEVNSTPAYDGLPELGGTTPKSHYADAAALAARYHVDMTFETQSFGHVSWLLRHHPELCALEGNLHVIRPLHEPTYELLDKLYSELCPLYDTPVFFAGCDEPWGIEEWAKERDLVPAEVVGKHIARVAELLKARGKKTMVWGDYLLKFPEALSHLPKEDVIICDWHYDPAEQYPSVDVFTKRGYTTLVSPAVVPARPVFPDYARQITNIRTIIRDGVRRGAVGLLNTNWPVDAVPMEAYWYGWVAGAEFAWNPSGRTQGEFDDVFFRREYGVPSRDALDAFAKLADLAALHALDKDARRSLREVVPTFRQIVRPLPPCPERSRELIRTATAALDACRRRAGADFERRWAAIARVPQRLHAALAYVGDRNAAAKAVADGDLADVRRALARLLDAGQRADIQDLARRLPDATAPEQVLSRLGLQEETPPPTVRLDPGAFFAVEPGGDDVLPPVSRGKEICFVRTGGAAGWRVDVARPGQYRLFALLRHSYGLWDGPTFLRGSRNAAYEGKYGIVIDGRPVVETWLGDELNPEDDEALQWALLFEGRLDRGEHSVRMRTSGPNFGVVREFLFTLDPEFSPVR